MGLINLRTNLKSLRYGQDRPGGGDSGQPYIQTSVTGKLLDVNIGNLNISVPFPDLGIFGRGTGGNDFLLRGGTQAPSRALKDVSRLSKMFFDTKSPKGVLFTIKQNMLSLSGVKTQGKGDSVFNQGIYLPTSTLAQAAGNAFGFHLNKQGTNPFRNTSPNGGGIFPIISSPALDLFGLPAYAQRVRPEQDENENRLVQLKRAKIITNLSNFPTDEELREEKQRQRSIERKKKQDQRKQNRKDFRDAKAAGSLDSFLDQQRIKRKQARDAARVQRQNARNAARPARPNLSGLTPDQRKAARKKARDERKQARQDARNQNKLYISDNPRHILQYPGGPNSLLGVGRTTIKRYSDTGEGIERANEALPEDRSPFGKTVFESIRKNIKRDEFDDDPTLNLISRLSFPTLTSQLGLEGVKSIFSLNPYLVTNTNEGLDFTKEGNDVFQGRYYVLDSSTIKSQSSSKDVTQIQDFRTSLLTQQAAGLKKNILVTAPNYNEKQIETRVNLGDPGKRNKNTISYTIGLLDENKKAYGALDRITAMPLYRSTKADHGSKGSDRNDLVKFSIGIIDNTEPNKRVYMHFRAFLDSMDDNYNAEWNDFRYMGRGEKFYRYNGFTRTVNLSWTVAAQSKEELIPMYQKLNFLASSLAPDYSANGYMRGNLAVLTVGGYLFEQPGIINSINYSVPQESPWEIGINDSQNAFGSDHTVKELPHIIKVTGFSFTPIHQFVPRLQQNTYGGQYTNKDGSTLLDPETGEKNIAISAFGVDGKTVQERYIALSRDTTPTGVTTNYNLPYDYTLSDDAKNNRIKRVKDLVSQYP
jgi:hypothetical protein